ncbi:MAG: hypothetical protein QG635_771 [Bacteroidota bacterium]|nr:hypothetical protein [Bacteroidota bacterium]
MKKITLFLALIFYQTVFSQSLSVFNLDTIGFPHLKAKFFAFDAAGNQITNLSITDFQVLENSEQRKVTYVSCPQPKPPQALSSVLTIDISGSMSGNNLLLAKEAAKAWLDGLPLGKSECAITSFDHSNYLNQDFTTDKNSLLNAVNSLQAKGGTNYDAALIEQTAGSLIITKNSKHKRVVVFLSDGVPNKPPISSDIISEANSQNVTIYSVILGMNCPQSMRDVSEQTGGMWYENVRTVEEARIIYQKILQTAQGGDPCRIEWESLISCLSNSVSVEIKLLLNGTKSNLAYQYPYKSTAKLEYNPPIIRLLNAAPGIKVEKKLTVTARNMPFNVSNITSTNAAFDINPKSFSLKIDQSIELTVMFVPPDSGYTYTKFNFINDVCESKFYVSGGFPTKVPKIRTLKLIHPNGGETFVVGSDTVITWDGVLPTDKVTLEYSTNNGKNWIFITDTARKLSYKWRVPKTPSKQCLARVTAKSSNIYVYIDMVLIPGGTFFMGNTGTYKGEADETPVHEVTISKDFMMSRTEITQYQYEDVMGKNPSYFKDDNLPVENISWLDAVEFCNKLSQKEGLEPCYSGSGSSISCNWNASGYRLPTEAEWEYACRAGTTTDFYSGNLKNEGFTPLDTNLDLIGWYSGNAVNSTYEVALKGPNAYGLFDMSGNVWEWCWDAYVKYSSASVIDPQTPTGSYRILRGGSWNYYSQNCRSSSRTSYFPSKPSWHFGLRIVKNL